MPVHYLLLHTLLLPGFCQVSMPLHYLLLLRTAWYKRRGTEFTIPRDLHHNTKTNPQKCLNPPPFQRLERDSSEMATSCCCLSIPTLPASSSSSPPTLDKKHLYLELSLAKTRCAGRLAVSLAESTRKKVRGKGEEDAGSHTGRRTERPQRAAKDASSRPVAPLRSSGPCLRS